MDAALLTAAAFWREDAPVFFDTSGSSGLPKQVEISKNALLISATAVNEHLSVTGDSCWGLALPLAHVGGFGVAARAYAAGCRLAQLDGRWNAAAFHDWVSRNRVSHTSLVPAQVHDLVRQRLPCPASLLAVIVGGGQLDAATGQSARSLGWPVLASYGMTEAASQIATQGLEALGTPYLPAPIPLLPIWQARIADDDLLEISGPALFSAYNIAGQRVPRELPWHRTADRARLDGLRLTPLGRADSLVKILGELVDPEAIERELIELSEGEMMPGDLVITPMADERAGHVLVPCFSSSTDPLLIEKVLQRYQAKAPGFRRLRQPVIMQDFPLSPLGKPRRTVIAAHLAGLL